LAMVAGRIAAEVAIRHLQEKMPLQEYQSRIREEFGIEFVAIGPYKENCGYVYEERFPS